MSRMEDSLLVERLGMMPKGQFLGLTLLILVATRFPSMLAPLMDSDEAVRAVGARILLAGGVPYLDFIDNKPPLTWFLFALVGGSVTGGRILAGLFSWLTALLVGEMLAGAAAGLKRLATVFYLLFSAAWLDRHFLTANTEVFMNLPLAAALVLAVRERNGLKDAAANGLAVGALFALAVLARPTALFAALAVAGVWLVAAGLAGEGRLRIVIVRSAGAAAGGIGVLGLGYAGFHLAGAGHEFLYWSFLSGGDIGATSNRGLDGFRRMATSLLPWVASAALLWAALVVSTAEILRRWHDSVRQPDRLLLAAVSWITIVPCAFGGRWRGHYFLQFLPSLVPLAAVFANTILNRDSFTPPRSSGRRPALVMAGALVPALAALVVNSSNLATGSIDRRIGEDVLGLSEHWKRDIPRQGTVFVWGYATGAYYLSGRMPASRYIVPVTKVSGYAFGSDAQRRGELDGSQFIDPDELGKLVSDLERSRPLEIADLSPGGLHGWGCCPMPPALASWVESRYTQADPVGRIVIWRRRDSP
ncbi:MAG: hypothetical protein KIT79_00555 [Deltaproteobacteria bacterium]|nr:hypothetical protein [Deltaproteobacteria bacterium]